MPIWPSLSPARRRTHPGHCSVSLRVNLTPFVWSLIPARRRRHPTRG